MEPHPGFQVEDARALPAKPLECGDWSPLLLLERLVAPAEPRGAARRRTILHGVVTIISSGSSLVTRRWTRRWPNDESPSRKKRRPVAALQSAAVCVVAATLLLSALAARAQDGGAVAGVVVSTWDGTPLPGVVVSVRGTTLAAQTGAGGRYELKNIPPGDQVLRFSKSSHATATVTDVRVLFGQTTTVNGNLRPEFFEMEEYEVTAEEFTDQTAQILLERKESSALMDGIGADFMSQIGAGDAAEALSKVSGASIADGKFAVIRGLADRYTSTTLNGTELPSADPDRKAAQLDLLPTQMIGRMDVAKTFSPDMAGGFAGGAINIVTRSPEKFVFNLSLGTSYNTQANLNDDFLASDRSRTDWLAMDDGKRELPAVARASSPTGTGRAIQNEAEVERSFGSSQMAPVADESPVNSSLSLTFGDSLKTGDFRLGYLGSLTYKNDYKFYDDGFVRKFDRGDRPAVSDKVDAKAVVEYTWATAAALSLGYKEDHELRYNFLYVQAAEDEARRLQGRDEESQPGTYVEQSVLHWTERNLTYHQLAGGHKLPELNDVAFDWAGALSTTTQEEPDQRLFQFVATPSEPSYQPFGRATPSYPSRFWRELEENNYNVRGDLTVPVPSYNDQDNLVKFGAAISESERDFFQRGFTMHPVNLTANTFYRSGDPQDYLDPVNYPYVQYRNFPVNVTYQGEQTITAGYLMGDWAALNWLRFVGGARLERTELSLSGFNQTVNQPLNPGNIQQDDILPSLSATVALRENLLLRAAWSQTVVRPTYREIAEVAIYDVAQARQYQGNSQLKLSDSENYDLRLEWYPRPGEIVSLSGFRKDITAPIEQGAEDTNNERIRYFNFEQAEVMGVEFELRGRLDRLWKPLEEFTLGFNAAYIESEVPLTDGQRFNRELLYGETATTRPLYDQPEYILNGDLTWEHAATGTTLTIAGGVVGRRLIVVGLARPDEYEEPAPQLDVFLSQKLGRHWKLKFSAKNLLDPAYEVSQDWGATGITDIKSYTKGMTFGLSLGCEF